MAKNSRRLALAATFLICAGSLSMPSSAEARQRGGHHFSAPFHNYVHQHRRFEPEFVVIQRIKRRKPRTVATAPAPAPVVTPAPMTTTTAVIEVKVEKNGDCADRCPGKVADAVATVSR